MIRMPSRTELPWPAITREVLSAIHHGEYKQFANVKFIAEDVLKEPHKYPFLLMRCDQDTKRVVQARTTMVLKKQGWTVRAGGKCSGTPTVFEIPERK